MKNWVKGLAAIGTATLGYLAVDSAKYPDDHELETDQIVDVRSNRDFAIDHATTTTRVALLQTFPADSGTEPLKTDWNDILNRIKQGDAQARDFLVSYVTLKETDAGICFIQKEDRRYPSGISQEMFEKIGLAHNLALALSDLRAFLDNNAKNPLDTFWPKPVSYDSYFRAYTNAITFLPDDDEFIRMIGIDVTKQELQDRFTEAQELHDNSQREGAEIRSGKRPKELLIDVE